MVHHELIGNVKFGITSGNPKPRLDRHKYKGFNRRVLVTGTLPDGVAHATERKVIETLRAAGHLPVQGRETFADDLLPAILATVSTYLEDKR